MIRFKEKEFEQYSICPVTGDIFDTKTGEVKKTYIINSRPLFKKMHVHCIMAHTFYGYKPGLVVHHLDENTLNNALSNLVYLTRAEHKRLHAGELLHDETRAKMSAAKKGKHRSEETKAKIAASKKGKPHPHKGKTFYDTKITSRSVSIPDDLWIKIEEICEKKDMKISAYFRSILMKEFDGESK